MIPKEVFEQTVLQFLAPVRPYIDDPSVSEIMINGPGEVRIERGGRIETTNAKFATHEQLMAALRNIAQFVGRVLNEERPILEARLPDGSRVEAIIPPAAPGGPYVAIRRFLKSSVTVDQLVEFGALTTDASHFLRAAVTAKQNVLVAGGTGSGKTTMLNALSSFIPTHERIVVIEDSQELQLQQDHVVQLEARPPDVRGKGEVSIRDLFKATLRMRPDRIVVGEIRSGEALDLVQAMTSGHGGGLATVHATYPHDTMTRIETMAMMSDVDMPLEALRIQIASAINLIVQTGRLSDGSRCVTHITEVLGYDQSKGAYVLADLYLREYKGQDERGRLLSTFHPTGALPRVTSTIEGLGHSLPPEMREAIRRQSKG
ncbi:MAG: CpaF family protein [Polyangiales bacterium]